MKAQTVTSSRLLIFLSSMALGCLIAIIVPSLFFNIFLLAFSRQILIIISIWFCFGIVFYFFISWGVNRFNVLSTLFMIDLSFQQMIRKNFLAIFFLFPVCLIAFQHFREFLQILIQGKVYDPVGWLSPEEGARSFLIRVLTLSVFLILMLFIVTGKPRLRQYLDDMPDYYYIIFILLAGTIIRLFFIYFINTQPVSDFANINSDALLVSLGERPSHIYVSTHIIITMIYGFLYQLFGPQLIIIKIFHGFVYGLSGVLFFYAGKQIFGSRLWAGLSGVLLVSWPSLAIYSNVLTPEHLFILMECALILAISSFFKSQEAAENENTGGGRRLLMFSVIGSLLGLSGMFRPFGALFLTAFVITFSVYKTRRERLIMNILGLFMVFMVFWLLGKIPMSVANYYHISFANVRPCNLLVGMNVNASGQYNGEDVDLCRKIRSQASDESEFTRTITKNVLERLRLEQDSLISFIDKKNAILWVNSNGIVYWAMKLAEGDDLVFALDVAQKVNLIDFFMMFIGTIAWLIGTVIAFFKEVKPVIFFCLLSFFGFNLMELFFEVQTRYRTVIMPLFIFFACWTFAALRASIGKNEQDIDPITSCESPK